MALTPCPECGNNVSTAATACPSCGHPFQGSASEIPKASPPLSQPAQIDAPVAPQKPCATPGCNNMRVDGNFCPDHTQTSSTSELTGKQGCLGCLGVLGVILVVSLLWTAGGAVVDWATGANDPNNEGSAAWCRKNRISEEHCGPLNDLAEGRDMTPSEYLVFLEGLEDPIPTPVVSDSDLLVAAVRLTVAPLYPSLDGVPDSAILTLAREVCSLVSTAVAEGVSPEIALVLIAVAVTESGFAELGAVMAGATLGAMETTTCSQHGAYIRQMLNSGTG